MTRMTGPDCAVMCNLINIHTYILFLNVMTIHIPYFESAAVLFVQVGIYCRESAGTGPVNLKVVPNECCLGRSPWTN